MRIAVLTHPQTWHFQDLSRAAAESHEVIPVSFVNLATVMIDDASQIVSGAHRLDQFECVIVRAMPKGSLGQVVFRMDVLQQLVRQGVYVVNSPKTIEASVDKYLSLALLQENQIPIPPTGVCQTSHDAIEIFERLGRDVVVKPIFGSQGRGLERINDKVKAVECFRRLESEEQAIYQQQFIDHGGRDLRLLVVGKEVFSIARQHATHWITNVSCGGQARKHAANDFERQLAIRTAEAVDGRVIGVDLMYDRAGNPFVVDVNAAPGWQAMSKTTGIDVATKILQFCNQELNRESSPDRKHA